MFPAFPTIISSAIVESNSKTLFCRVNTFKTLLSASLEVSKGTKQFIPWEEKGKKSFVSSSAKVNPKTNIGPGCVIGNRVKIGEKCTIKDSSYGNNVEIADKAVIMNSIIMDNVKIGEGYNFFIYIKIRAKIDKSIICADIPKGVEISESFIGYGYARIVEKRNNMFLTLFRTNKSSNTI